MCFSTNIGAHIKIPKNNVNPHEYLFGEDQSRYIIEVSEENKKDTCKILEKNSIYYDIIGKTQKEYLSLNDDFNIKLSDIKNLNSLWFKDYFKES